uniref:Centromere protein Q n=1 Tax=Gasterosteus aculeatus aculeatus TaxID=481459 RepID=A0AAQ4S5J1_GASAC|nr:centromere protein Q [Gasterosteus aculeatus aculeatus]
MKPARGSNRASSQAPNLKPKKKTDQTMVPQTPEHQDPQVSERNRGAHPNPARKRKAGGASSVPQKVKKEEKWKLMPVSSVVALENIMDLSILATLALRQKEKKGSQEHLNIMKTRFLAQCSELKVPLQKKADSEQSSQRHQEEAKKLLVGKTSLSSLEEDLRSVVRALETTDKQNVSLRHSCSELRKQVEEEFAKEILRIAEQADLNLPRLLPQPDGTTLEARLRRIIPESESETTARKLGEILQTPGADRAAQALLLQAHKHADQLFNPGFTTTAAAPCSDLNAPKAVLTLV